MASDKQEMSFTLLFGIAGILIAFAALTVAFLQLRKTRRVHHVYELA
jgi:uncharacterized integral membrane protein